MRPRSNEDGHNFSYKRTSRRLGTRASRIGEEICDCKAGLRAGLQAFMNSWPRFGGREGYLHEQL